MTGLIYPALGMAVLDALSHAAIGKEPEVPTLPDTSDLTDVLPGSTDDVTQVLTRTISSVAPIDPNHLTDAVCLDCLGVNDLLAIDGPIMGPVAAVENNAVQDSYSLIDGTGNALGDPVMSAARALTSFGESVGLGAVGTQDNLLSAVLAAPDETLDGQAVAAVCDCIEEAGDTLGSAGTFVNQLIDTVNIGNPLGTGLVQDVAGALGSGPLFAGDLLDLDGNGSGGGLIQAVVNSSPSQPGALINLDVAGDGSPSGSHHLVDVGAGPGGGSQIGTLDILAKPGSGSDHTFDVGVLDVGSGSPQLLDADIATNDSFLSGLGQPDLGTPSLGSLCDIGGVPGLVGGIDPASMVHHMDVGHGLLA